MGKPMRHNMRNRKNEQGTALVVTLIFLMAMGVLSTALVFTVNNEMKTSAAYKYNQQAFYTANAGVQRAVEWYRGSYSPYFSTTAPYDNTTLPVEYSGSPVILAGKPGDSSAYPDSTTTTSFTTNFHNKSLTGTTNNSGVYALNATLVKYREAHFINPTTFASYTSAIERWSISSSGYWGTIARPLGIAQITAVIENTGNTLFDRALWGIDYVDLVGTSFIDSYDPARPYDSTTNSGDLGAIGSNGTVRGQGGATIQGDVAYGPTGSISLGINTTVTGDIIHLPEPRYFPPVPSFSVGTSSDTIHPSNGKSPTPTLSPGLYGSLTVHGPVILEPGSYYMDSLSVSSQGEIHVSGPTTIYVKTSFDLEGNGVINDSMSPSNLTIFYAGTDTAKLAGSSSVAIEYYGPSAPLVLTGGSDYFGSFVGKTVDANGGTNIHFSESSLNEHLYPQPYRIITWSQDTL